MVPISPLPAPQNFGTDFSPTPRALAKGSRILHELPDSAGCRGSDCSRALALGFPIRQAWWSAGVWLLLPALVPQNCHFPLPGHPCSPGGSCGGDGKQWSSKT